MPRVFPVINLLLALCLAWGQPAQGADIPDKEVLWTVIQQSYSDFVEGRVEVDVILALLAQGLNHPGMGMGHKGALFNVRSNLNLALGNLDLARSDAKLSVTLTPEYSPEGLSFLAEAGQLEGDEDHMNMALTSQFSFDALTVLVTADILEGRYDAAREYLEQGWKLPLSQEEAAQLNNFEEDIALAQHILPVEEFFAQYQADPTAVERQYQNRNVPIRGSISRIAYTQGGLPLLTFTLENGGEVRCELAQIFNYIVARLKVGDEVTVGGYIKSSDGPVIVLDDVGILTCFAPDPLAPTNGETLWKEIGQANTDFKNGNLDGGTALGLLTRGVDSPLVDVSRKGVIFAYRGFVHAIMGNLNLAWSDARLAMAVNPDMSAEAFALMAAVECAGDNYTRAHSLIALGREHATTTEQVHELDRVESNILLAENAFQPYTLFKQYRNIPGILDKRYPDGVAIRGRVSRMEQTPEGLWVLCFRIELGQEVRCEMDALFNSLIEQLDSRDEVVIWGNITTSTGSKLVLENGILLTWPSKS